MKKKIILIFLFLCINSFSQTQSEMSQDAYAQFQEVDDELNRVYKQILNEYKTDSVFLNNLKKSQKLWIQFRDSELSMKFPNYENQVYGSMHSMCRAFYLKKLTEIRVKTLKEWIIKENENYDCNNSVKSLIPIDIKYSNKATIDKKGNIYLRAYMKKDHRIIGYKLKDFNSEKMIIISIFTDEIKDNPFSCKYGAYYDTNSLKEYHLKYLATEGEFLKVAIIKQNNIIDNVYMKSENFEFEL